MSDLKKDGKIRAIGVSNFSRSQLEEISCHGRIDSLQPPYSLFWRHVEKDAMPYCLENDITILAYSSMAQGLLTGKFSADHRFTTGDHRTGNRLFQEENMARALKALDMIRPIAEQKGITPGQLALAWVCAHPQTCAIAGARSEEQVRQNAAAAEVRLSLEDLKALDGISRIVTDHLDDNPVMWQ